MLAAAGSLQLSSSDFSSGGTIPARAMSADCGGANRSPELSWRGAPNSAKSFALTVYDPDAPIAGGYYHWVVYNLPASRHELGAGAKLTPAQLGITTPGTQGYHGPCPPPGPAHHYIFTLYALDLDHIAGGPYTAPKLEARLKGHILAQAALTATASSR